MSDRAFSSPKVVRQVGYFTLIVAAIVLSIQHLQYAATNHIFGDEAAVLWVWNHPFLSRNYFCAIASHIMAPPADFVLGGAWWRVLERAFPAWTNMNLELAVRTYPNFIMTLATLFLGGCLYLLTDSWLITVALTIFFTKTSPVVNLYFAEERFYPALYLCTILCWFCYLRAEKTVADARALIPRVTLFLLVCAGGVWFHFYVLFTAVGLLAALGFELQKRGMLQDLLKNRYIRLGLFSLFLSYILMFIYMARFANKTCHPSLSLFLSFPISQWWPTWKSGAKEVFALDIRWLLGILVLLAGAGLFSSHRGQVVGRSALVLWVLFCSLFVMITQGGGHYTWGGRYIFFILPSVVLLMGFLVKVNLPSFFSSYDRSKSREALWAPVAAIALLWIVPIRGGERIYPDGGDAWVRMRKEIVRNHLKVVGVLGVMPHGDRSLAGLEHGGWVGMSWELYANGLHRLPSIKDYGEAKKNAGLLILPCSRENEFQDYSGSSEAKDQNIPVYIDYCVPATLVTPKAMTSTKALS